MLPLQVKFEDERGVNSTEFADVFWNGNIRGLATGSIDEGKPVNGAPLQLFAGEPESVLWGQSPWGVGPWTGLSKAPTATFQTPAVCWGLVKIGAKTRDRQGNYQTGVIATAEHMVNSTPERPNDLKRGAFAGGQQAFTFDQSPQVRT